MTQELFSLEGRIALVTGGNGGLGRAIALGFLATGAQVAITGRNPEKNDMVGKELGASGTVFSLDVRDEEAVERTTAQVVAQYGHLDILVNNAGIWRGNPSIELSREDWDAVIATNLTGPFLCAKHAAKAMMAFGHGGKIINIGSMYSIFGPDTGSNYASSKTGILGLTRALAVDLAAYNVQVNAILPGWHVTDMTQGLQGTPRAEEIRRKTPAGRWGNANDVVGAAIFLATAASDFVTGVCLPVDGGYSIAEHALHD